MLWCDVCVYSDVDVWYVDWGCVVDGMFVDFVGICVVIWVCCVCFGGWLLVLVGV